MKALITETLVTLLFAAMAALLLMSGLHGFHIGVGFGPCFALCMAAHPVLRNGASS